MQIEGWDFYKLEDIADINPSKSPRPENGLASFIPMESVSESAKMLNHQVKPYDEIEKGFTSFKNSDVLVAKITPCFENGKGALVENLENGIGFGSTEFHVLRANGKSISKYLYYLTNSHEFRIRGEMNMQGSAGQKRVTTDYLKSYKVNLPPIEEQKKIATILSTWDKVIETVEKLVANSQQQKKALMQQLLTGQKRLLDDKGVKFGGEWEEYSLGEWLKEYNQKSSTNNEYEVLTSSRNGLVKQSDYFGENRLVQRDNTGFNVIPPNYLTYRSRSDDGSFYFNRNNFEFNGLISTYYPVFEFPNGDTNFFLNLLNQNSTLFSAYSVGTSQKVLSLNALKQVKFRLPLKKEQEKIAQVLTLADREIDLYQQQLDKLKLEKKALMQQLLTGQKRVKLET